MRRQTVSREAPAVWHVLLGRLRRVRSAGGFVTIGVVVATVMAMAFTVMGASAASHVLRLNNGAAWLWSGDRAELDRVNLDGNQVDSRMPVNDADGHQVKVEQTNHHLLLHDLDTGTVTSFDLANLDVGSRAKIDAKSVWVGVTDAAHGDAVVVANLDNGVVTRLDPDRLTTIGKPLQLPPNIKPVGFDQKGLLWMVAADQGTAIAVTLGASSKSGPKNAGTIPVGGPQHTLDATVLDRGIAVVDYTVSRMTTVTSADDLHPRKLDLPGLSDGSMPGNSGDDPIVVTEPGSRRLVIVDHQHVSSITAPGDGGSLESAVSFRGRIYAVDEGAHQVLALNDSGEVLSRIDVGESAGAVNLTVEQGHMLIDAAHSAVVKVVDPQHRVTDVDRFPVGVPGGATDPTPEPPADPTPQEPPAQQPPARDQGQQHPGGEPPAGPGPAGPPSGPAEPPASPNPPPPTQAPPPTHAPPPPTQGPPPPPRRPPYPKDYSINVSLSSGGQKLASFSGTLKYSGPNTYDAYVCITDNNQDSRGPSFELVYTYMDGSRHTTRTWGNPNGSGTQLCHESWVHAWGPNIDSIQMHYWVQNGPSSYSQAYHNGAIS